MPKIKWDFLKCNPPFQNPAYGPVYTRGVENDCPRTPRVHAPHRHETSTALWNPYRRVSLRGRRAQIRFSRGARCKKLPSAILVLRRKYTDFRARFAQCICGSAIIGMPSCVFRFFTGRHSSGSSPKAGCLCSLYYISNVHLYAILGCFQSWSWRIYALV